MPLEGKTVLITRSKKQAADLGDLLKKAGAHVFEAPAIEIVLQPENVARLKQAIRDVRQYSWLLLTSVNSVAIIYDVLKELGLDWSVFASLQIGCIGTSTAGRVRSLGGAVTVVPTRFQAEGLLESMLQQGVGGKRILLPRAQGSRPILPEELSRNGAIVNEIHIYKAGLPEESHEKLAVILHDHHIDFITFTSSSTVRHFVEMAGDLISEIDFGKTRLASIGPITSATLKEHGLPVAVEATEFTMSGLVRAMSDFEQ
jgi:uroporphyrinogen-III synthase